MRKISPGQICVFFILLGLIVTLGIGSTALLAGKVDFGEFQGVVLFLLAIVLVYVYAFLVYRLFQHFKPLHEGEIPVGSEQEFVYHVYLLFFLILFYPVMRSGMMPVPLMRLVYLALGARLGDNTYSSGIILDPKFVEIGSNSLIGQYALIVPHVIENEKLGHYPVKIGNNVTIGAHAVVLSDVEIGDAAMVATGAIVKKGTRIAAGEVWGGVPARRLEGGREEAEGLCIR